MQLKVTLGARPYQVNAADPIDISIPLVFNGYQPNTYGVPPATAAAYEDGRFVGDTRRGGSCNFESYRLTPHCNGTHTEGVGHITHQRISIHDILKDAFIPATLITVDPEPSSTTTESCVPSKNPEDVLITAKNLYYKLEAAPREFLSALVIRTRPNDDSKIARDYMKTPPPFFSLEAMDYLAELGIKHLLVDVPSLDRLYDEGQLRAHHMFWSLPPGSHDVDEVAYSLNTITEMIYVPDRVDDGRYMLTIQIPPFVSDAAPSRPLLFRLATD